MLKRNIHAVLVNIGSPASCERQDVERFIERFLMDRYVISLPWAIRRLLVRYIIVPLRIKRVVARYNKFWGEAASPLVEHTAHLATKVITALAARSSGATLSVVMRHGERNFRQEFRQLRMLGVEDLLIVPQFPQYELSTHQSVIEAAQKAAKNEKMRVRFVAPFFNDKDYIDLLSNSMCVDLESHEVDKLVYSFHSVPLKNLPCTYKEAVKCELQGEVKSEICETCYKRQCYTTARLASERLGVNNYVVAFQSNMGFGRWLSPTLNATLSTLPQQGAQRVAVVSPSFMVECLETLEEVNERGRELFMRNGGREYHYIPAINESDDWAHLLAEWIMEADNSL